MYNILNLILQILLGLFLLLFGAEWLVHGSMSLAIRLGVSTLIASLTIISIGTSSPELFVSLNAVLEGNNSIAISNIVGSNICNIGLILGLCIIIRPIKVHLNLLFFDISVLFIVTSFFVFIAFNKAIYKWHSVFFLITLISYIVICIRNKKDKRFKSIKIKEKESSKNTTSFIIIDFLLISNGSFMLFYGADCIVEGIVKIGEFLEVSNTFIGLTIIALGTSLPELVTSLMAAYRKQEDIIIGNIIGSNIFNILGILGIVGIINPISIDNISLLFFFLMLILTAFLFIFMFFCKKLSTKEGFFFISIFFLYYIFIFIYSFY